MISYRYSSDWIYQLESQNHWQMYWYQLELIQNNITTKDHIVEIGVGTRLIYNYLKNRNFQISSIDIDPVKRPDYVENIVNIDVLPEDCNTILAFNIFEHIPYEDFRMLINKFNSWNVNKVFIGLPYNRKILFSIHLQVGRFLNKIFHISIRKRKILTQNHHWELDFKHYTKKRIITDFNNADYLCDSFFKYRNNAYFYFKKI